MPRVSFKLFQERRLFLTEAWLAVPEIYSILSIQQQRDVHAVYSPTKDLTTPELRAHWRGLGQDDPSQPARAGKAFQRLLAQFNWAYDNAQGDDATFDRLIAAPYHRASSQAGGSIRVQAVVRPEADISGLASALLPIAVEMAEEQKVGKK